MPMPKILTPASIKLKEFKKDGLVIASFMLESSVGVSSLKPTEKFYTYKISMQTHAALEKSHEILNVAYFAEQYYLTKLDDKHAKKYNSYKITHKELVNYIADLMRNNGIFFKGKEVEDIKHKIFLYLGLDASIQSKENKTSFEKYMRIGYLEPLKVEAAASDETSSHADDKSVGVSAFSSFLGDSLPEEN
jgi:hypothetical protein